MKKEKVLLIIQYEDSTVSVWTDNPASKINSALINGNVISILVNDKIIYTKR